MSDAEALTIEPSIAWMASDARQDSLEMMLSSRPGLSFRKNG